MNIGRLDTLRHLLSEAPSRRGIGRALAALTLSGGVAALVGPGDAGAKKKCKKKKKCPKSPFCAGKNSCAVGDVFFECDDGSGGQCFCLVAVGTGEPFCGDVGTGLPPVAACTQCPEGSTCVYLAPGCSVDPLGCVSPCPNPL